ncbi:MAG TPA: DUF86 domain-containing protein [Chitinophagaceae bacterium]|nr:DUF86 domain-containing protein [Chitinophagaceae bacterium]
MQQYTSDLSFDGFSDNFMAVEACLYNIQVIGEAVAQLPADIKENTPEIPWILIKGMRNRLIHEYFGTDLSVVWNVITNELPAIKIQLEQIQSDLSKENR